MDRARRRIGLTTALGLVMFAPAGQAAWAGEPTVVAAKATRTGDSWRFDVTVRHADEGWDHYANAFVITLPDGTELGTRVLHHPHVDEQPFTRSLGGVRVPAGTERVHVHAVDKVHGAGPAIAVDLR